MAGRALACDSERIDRTRAQEPEVATAPSAAPPAPARLPEDNGGFERMLRSGSSASALPGGVRSDMENAFGGQDFSDVRVHTGSQATSLNRAVQAEAFTTGRDIYFSDGLDASSSSGRELLAHELTHVVQQRSGPVNPGVSDPHDATEVQAAQVGRSVAAMPSSVVESLGGLAGNAAVARLASQRSSDA